MTSSSQRVEVAAHPKGHLDARLVALVGGDRVGPVGGEVEARGAARRAPGAARRPGRARRGRCGSGRREAATRYQTPAFRTRPSGSSGPGDDRVRARVVELEALAVPDALRDRRQVRDVLAGPEPAGGVEVEPLEEAARAPAQLRRERREDLEPRRGDDGAEPELGGRPGQARQEQRVGLLGGHAGQPRAVAVDEPDAAVGPALGVDRDARGAQRLDVAMDRAHRDLELARRAPTRSSRRGTGAAAGARRAWTRAWPDATKRGHSVSGISTRFDDVAGAPSPGRFGIGLTICG